MDKVTQASHDEICAHDAADDSGAEDGAGTAVTQDLGDSVVPFPREWNEKLAREMIHVWEIDVGVIWNPSSGKSVLAFILENRRAVGIMNNRAHMEFVVQRLMEAVKANSLAPDPQKQTHGHGKHAHRGKRGKREWSGREPGWGVRPGQCLKRTRRRLLLSKASLPRFQRKFGTWVFVHRVRHKRAGNNIYLGMPADTQTPHNIVEATDHKWCPCQMSYTAR
jgi:hypothetical protein